jgi:hypothetical protein
MIVAVTGVVPVLEATNPAMSPVPLEGNPILVLLLVQPNVAPDVPAKVTAAVVAPSQTTWLDIADAVGVGLTMN